MISHILPQNGTACNGAPAAAESSPADLPEFTSVDAMHLGMDHDLSDIPDRLRAYYDDLGKALGVSLAGPLNPAHKDFHRDQVRRAALRTARDAVEAFTSMMLVLTSTALQAAAADRFVKQLESEYQADRELADARRKRRRVSTPAKTAPRRRSSRASE